MNGTGTYAKASPLNVSINYAHAISPPWPNGTPGLSANYTCVRGGGDPATVCTGQTFTYDPACSRLPASRATNISFACQLTVGPEVADGPVTICVQATDSAVPDNPSNSNQLLRTNGQPVDASDANISAPGCGWVILDRTAPALTAGAPTTAKVGQLVSLTAAGTDAGSGLSNQWTWKFGDNTADGSGVTATHTFTQAGTFQVKLLSADTAGNVSEATRTIVVSAATTGTPGTPGTPGAPGTPGTPGIPAQRHRRSRRPEPAAPSSYRRRPHRSCSRRAAAHRSSAEAPVCWVSWHPRRAWRSHSPPTCPAPPTSR